MACFDLRLKGSSFPTWFDNLKVVIKSPTRTETVAVADIITLTDYYPFGMAMPGRTLSNSEHYRYGFNGMEKDDDWYGAGNEYTTEFRQLDVRTGRWMSMDPMMAVVPDRSPYEFVFNNPVALVDPDGLLPFGKGGGNKSTVKSKHGHANKGSGKSPKGSVGKKVADKEMKQTKTITNMTEKNRYFSSDRFKRTAEKKVSLTTGKLSQSINIEKTNLVTAYLGDHTNDGTGIDKKPSFTGNSLKQQVADT